jgi:hypothetical protein
MNVADLANGVTAAQALGNLVLVTPQLRGQKGYQPKQVVVPDGTTAQSPPSFVFHLEEENVVNLESDITDHFVEDNTAIQDQIALKPEIVVVTGFIGELNDIAPTLLAPLDLLAEKLTTISGYTPGFSTTALLAYNRAKLAYDAAFSLGTSLVSSFNSISGKDLLNEVGGTGISDGQSSQNRQQAMFTLLYGYWRNRYLFDVQTPWAIFKNMAIKSMRATQDPNTRTITEFRVEFKTMRFASVVTLTTEDTFSQFQSQGRAAQAASSSVDFGPVSPVRLREPVSSLWGA